MRDAAAKFLVQFRSRPPGKRLAHDEPRSVQSGLDAADNLQIEAVPDRGERSGRGCGRAHRLGLAWLLREELFLQA